jgi:hypothetical protein
MISQHILNRFGIRNDIQNELDKYTTSRPCKYKNDNRGDKKLINKASSKLITTKRLNDINFKLKTNFASLLRYHVNKENNKTFDILGYNVIDLKRHLERQFEKGMKWDNYGSYWHIDHIIPASWFKYESYNDEQFKQCWRLENLKPMKAEENMSKQNRYTENAQLKILIN